MAGPNLEIVKFGFYMFFPIYVMFKFGDPEWYESYVKPYKEVLWPPYESTYQPPRTHEGVVEELARMKNERLARAQRKLNGASAEVREDASISQRVSALPSTAATSASPAPTAAAVPAPASSWSWPSSNNNNDGERLV